MHIVFLSDWESRGGAAIVAGRLAGGLAAAGAQVTRLVVYADGREHPWRTERLAGPGFPLRRALRRALPIGARAALDRGAEAGAARRLDQALARLRPDLVHLHNLHGGGGAGWSPELLRVAAAHAPVAWTLHDMWPITGRCVYSLGCRRFETGCTAECPTARAYPALPPDQVAPAWRRRRELIAQAPRLAAVAPSRWMAAQARAGIWAGRAVAHIPNGLDLGVYRPHARAAARAALGLPAAGPIALAAMPDLADPRKGAALLGELARALAGRPLTLLTMGAGRLRAAAPGLRLLPLGYVADEDRRALAYAAADLLIHAAPEDNLPTTLIEAMACGTPTVALPVGGVPELVSGQVADGRRQRAGHDGPGPTGGEANAADDLDGATGWLADGADAPALARALALALDEIAAGADLRGSCRAVAEAEYGLGLMVERHLALYDRLRG